MENKSENGIITGLNVIIPLKLFRKTDKVTFDIIPEVVKGLSSVDRVVHGKGAISPTIEHKSDDEIHWYMHPNQSDNLLVVQGKRMIELYNEKHGKVEHFEVTPDYIKLNGAIVYEGAAILGWPTHVFHRVISPDGSTSINFAKHFEGFDPQTNFNIWDLNVETGSHECAREGHMDENFL